MTKPITYSFALLVALAGSSALAQPAGDGAPKTPPAEPDASTSKDAGKTADAAEDADVESLRQEYLKLRDRLFRARARVATVASALYSTRLRVHLDYTSARFYTVSRATIRLDGSNVFDDTEAVVTRDKAPRFDGFVAPGRHQIEIRIEAAGKEDERFKSVITNSFTVQAPAGKDLMVYVKAKDGGDIPYKWKKKEAGSYRLHLDVSVRAKKIKGAKPAAKKARPKKANAAKRARVKTAARSNTNPRSRQRATRSHGKHTKTRSAR